MIRSFLAAPSGALRGPCLVLTLLAGICPQDAARASIYVVDRYSDSTIGDCTHLANDCALRGAILAANANVGPDTVQLDGGIYELSIEGPNDEAGLTGDLDINDALTLVGRGPERTTIDALDIDRVIDIDTTGTVTLRGIGVRGGFRTGGGGSTVDAGAGVRVKDGTVTLDTCWVYDNESSSYGGGVFQYDDQTETLTVVRSWIHDNTGAFAGGISAASFLLEQSAVTGNHSAEGPGALRSAAIGGVIRNSTLAGNTAADYSCGGGSIEVCGGAVVLGGAIVQVQGSTLLGNDGHDLRARALGAGATSAIRLSNSVVVGDCSASPGVVGAFLSFGGNVESPGDTCALTAADLASIGDAGISPTADWCGGPTPIHKPSPASVAVDFDYADDACPALDQRGQSRPREGDGSEPMHCDSGAAELHGPGDLFLEGFESGFFTPWDVRVP